MLFRPFSEPGNLNRNGQQMICPKCKDTNPAQRCNNGMLWYVVFMSKMFAVVLLDDGLQRLPWRLRLFRNVMEY